MFHNVRRISRQLIAYGTADVMVLAVNFLLLPLYTRVLTPREYGALALLLLCEGVLKILNRWGLDTSFLRFSYECRNEDERRTLSSTIAGFLLVANGLLLIALAASAVPANRLIFGSTEFLSSYLVLIVNGFVSTFLFLPLNLLRIQERSRLFASLTFLRAFGTVLIRLVLVVGLRFGVFGIMLADTIMIGGLFLALAPTLRSMIARRFSNDLLRRALAFGLPQVPFGVLTQATSMADRFILSLYMPLAQVGLYLIGVTVAGVIKFYPVAFEAAWTPFAYASLERRDAPALFAKLGTYAFAVLAFLTVALAGVAPVIIQLALPATYHAAAPVVPLLVVAMAVQSVSWFLVTSLNIAKQTHVFPIVTIASAAVGIGANVVLIPWMGMRGAALALFVSQALATALIAYFAQRAYHVPYQMGRLAKICGVSVATYLVMVIASPALPWQAAALRTAALLLFPAGLFVLRFFEPHELADFRRLFESRGLAPLPRPTQM